MRIRRCAVIGTAAVLLAGCGGSDSIGNPAQTGSAEESTSALAEKDAAEIVDAAFTALEGAGAAHVTGSIEEAGTTQELDLQLQGEDAQGSIVMDGVTVELVYVGGTAYVMAPADFWASFGMPAEFAAQLEGQWVLMPAEAASSFGALTLSGLVDELRASGSDQVEGEVTTDELDGEPVVVVTQADGSTLTVADDEENPYPLVIEDKGDAPATVEFSDFGQEVEIAAPADPLDLNDLGG
ncbi:hypothetical protein [Blastococcus xanthinilyticus]|uniref:Lipoprotein LprG n=1 Tax=Blastococcus xanthinilyticus TaxID=1564164 RepID=A0A5S5CYC1_9ACTN|nr:hypothetical protein [Blastococcus xanthinilyticus]TYP88074.1 hypothetical protein BD833_105250 [Blastococcus xanthinilyticus]